MIQQLLKIHPGLLSITQPTSTPAQSKKPFPYEVSALTQGVAKMGFSPQGVFSEPFLAPQTSLR